MVGTSLAAAPIILTKLSYASHFDFVPPSTLMLAALEYHSIVEDVSVVYVLILRVQSNDETFAVTTLPLYPSPGNNLLLLAFARTRRLRASYVGEAPLSLYHTLN
ncbi:MAG: hypothetical protein QF704_03015 [Anaerolineales bacterium]|jgi:hypothetical protein|nr:hypothetical protein [Anaerolineales bacterium]